MHRNKRIAIILPDTLQCIGLQSVLTDYFPPVEVCCFPAFEVLPTSFRESFDYYITRAEVFLLYADFFLPRRNKTILLMNDDKAGSPPNGSLFLYTHTSSEILIEQLGHIFMSENTNINTIEGNKELSSRETDVLQLIVKGYTNKDIADKLNISLNTVLSHRKNITAKLGIKTVSGLTFYAIMNGLIAGDEIEL